MKRIVVISLFLMVAIGLSAQDFIGCRTDSGWAETPMVRKHFYLKSLPQYGTFLEVTSLGYHEVYINGTKVGDCVLQPAVSQLDKRALTVYYDISSYVHKEKNEVMIWVGQGWGRIYGTPATVQAEVVLGTLPDMLLSAEWTDSTWEASPSGYSYTDNWQPMHFGGERFDARVKPDWRPASVYDASGITISRQEFKGNHIVDTIAPVTWISAFKSNIFFDFGRVVTGWLEVDFPKMPEGTPMYITYMDKRGSIEYCEEDIYIARGRGKEHFINRFHSHSFRYVSIKTVTPDLPITEIKSRALQISAVDPTGGATFECSDPRLNAIHDMVKYTLSCLTFSGYMVDCPHIERMGYGGDGNSSTMTLQTIWDVRDTYKNWLTAWSDAMDSTGDLPYVAPAFRTGGGPYWSGFIIKAPWRIYLNYGDHSLIHEQYDEMVRWLKFVERHIPSPLRGTPPNLGEELDGVLNPWPDTERRGWFLGDWLAPEGVDIGGESVLHVSNCFLAECLADMVHMARMTGHYNDANRFAAWRERLVKDIHRHFYHPETHTYANGTVLDQCYALLMGIPPDSATAQAVKDQLLKDIHGKYRDHIAVGLMGVPIFTEWCIRERQADLMATILRQEDYPGYLNMINNGATTTWESWDCGRPGKEDRSRVHNCYNGIGIWFYQALAGIRPDNSPSKLEGVPEGRGRVFQPGYLHFFIDPQPVKGIEWVKATKPTDRGAIRVEIKDSKLKVIVPEGSTATVFPNTARERTIEAGEWDFVIPTSEFHSPTTDGY